MVTLSKDFDFSLGYETDEYYRPKKTYRKLKTPDKPITPKSPAVAYLESRGISKEVAERYEITTQTDHDNVLVFPFYDEDGKLQFVKYRKTDFDKTKDKNKEWCEANCKPILFGMKQCKDFSTLVCTEGQLDQLSVVEAGIDNVVSVPTGAKGFTWVPYCWDWINQFEEIVVFGDYEKGHITLLDELTRRLKIKVKHVREEDYKDCKDANEILQKYGKEQVRKCVENAVLVPMKQVIELADVEDVDIFKIPKLQTGIKQVDKLLYGGLPFGGVVVISAKSGSGKSTLASQILVNAIAQDYICFAYSGELPNYLFKAWLDFQVAGGRHIVEYQNRWGDTQYNVSAANKELIKAWYRGKCYLYDNSAIADDETEEVSLIKLTENMIMQYGVQVILLDNLMTAIGLESVSGNDKYEKQSEFMKDLSRLALRHNALILLVAHKRKNNFSTNEDDETSGSSDIPNLATITMSYNRDSEIEENQRKLKISKNRLFGKVETNGFIVNYDPKSKRIYGQGDDLYVEYGWRKVETKDDGFVAIDDINFDNPFEEGEHGGEEI
jgi:KaiC/GvpD/RAD55 family RecA-like ATPase